jgi:hypothetical protein
MLYLLTIGVTRPFIVISKGCVELEVIALTVTVLLNVVIVALAVLILDSLQASMLSNLN